TYPSASASNALQRPSGERIHDCDIATLGFGQSMTFTPPATAIVESPERKLWQARCTASSDEEHAVSSERLDPRRSKKFEMRLDAMLERPPIREYALM